MGNNLFKESAILIKNNLLLIQPMFFGILIVLIVLAPVSTKTSVDIGYILALSIGFLCFTSCLAGWFNCVKAAVSKKNKEYKSNEEYNKAQFEILKNFFPGVADYLFPLSFTVIIYIVLAYSIISLYRFLSMKIFILKNFPSDIMQVISTASQSEIAKYLETNLSSKQLLILSLILILGTIAVYLIFYLFVLWFAPALFYSSKNPFNAIVQAVKFLFQNFGMSVKIIFFMTLINIIISLLSLFLGKGFFAFIPLLLQFAYFMYYTVTVFLYYESKTQDNSTCGAKLDRQV